MVDWRRGLLIYVELDKNSLEEFKRIVGICGGRDVCMSSLAARLRVKSALYITDIYGISNELALSRHIPRVALFERIWSFLDSLFCSSDSVECDEEIKLKCCVECGYACLLAKTLSPSDAETTLDLREEIKRVIEKSIPPSSTPL